MSHTWPQPSLHTRSVGAQLCLLSVLWDGGCWGREIRALGLSNAGSWIQASGAMVTVTIATHGLHSALLPGSVGGFHRLELIERGDSVVVRALLPQ